MPKFGASRTGHRKATIAALEHRAFIRGQKQLEQFCFGFKWRNAGYIRIYLDIFKFIHRRKRSKNVSWNDWVWAHGALDKHFSAHCFSSIRQGFGDVQTAYIVFIVKVGEGSGDFQGAVIASCGEP